MTNLSLSTILPLLRTYLDNQRHRQIRDSNHPHFGALLSEASNYPEAQPTAGFVTMSVLYLLAEEMVAGGHGNDNESREQMHKPLLLQATLAVEALPKMARPSGLFDLANVNPDSAPDTGFILQYLCGGVALAQELASPTLLSTLTPLLEKMGLVIRTAFPGMLTGGFHTPNHRWVMVAAMIQAISLYPDLDEAGVGSSAINAYLAEGFDIDSEGAFIERSVGVYDAVNTRSLLLIADYLSAEWPDATVRTAALEAVQRNLHFDFHLLHADGTAETGLSRRQDYGTREVAIGLVPSLLLYNRLAPEPSCIAMAQHLWSHAQRMGEHLLWIGYALLRGGEPKPACQDEGEPSLLPTNFARHFPQNGIWRVRREQMSASAFEGVTRLFGLIYGRAELTSLKISHCYFGGAAGHFISDSLRTNGDTEALLRSNGTGKPRRPAYELPLSRAVPPDQYSEMVAERALRPIPPIAGELTITEINREIHVGPERSQELGFDFHYQTTSGLSGIQSQIAFDFPAGGIWETPDTRLRPTAGQVIFLKQGRGEMRYNNDVIRIELGTHTHGTWTMRDAETAPNHVRILLTFVTPVDFRWRIRVYQGLG